MKVQIKGDTEPVIVAGPEELVTYLNETAEFSSESPSQYMLDYAKRSVIQRDIDIRATDFISFVEDLITNGDIKIII